MKKKIGVSHDEFVIQRIRDNREFAAHYLKEALEDGDPQVLLVALRRLAQARGVARVAKAAGVERESLYRTPSPRGNPRMSTLLAVIKAIGLKLTVDLPR